MNALARALEARRSQFNAQFAQARRLKPRLDAAAFAEHLRATVAPIVEAVAQERPEKVDEVVEVLYDLSLELVGSELLGPKARTPAIAEGWRLLADLPAHVAAAPRLFAGSVTNALYNLGATPGARPRQWVKLMLEHGRTFPDVPSLLEAGKVAAWRAGLPHYREGALAACEQLGPDLARRALGLPVEGGAPVPQILARLKDDPWLSPSAADSADGREEGLQVVACVGAFRGFGGLFRRPPEVFVRDDHFQVFDGEECWVLTADVFGVTFHRAPPETGNRGGRSPRPSFTINAQGVVTRGGQREVFHFLRDFKSCAANATTLAVTRRLSHSVYLIA